MFLALSRMFYAVCDLTHDIDIPLKKGGGYQEINGICLFH